MKNILIGFVAIVALFLIYWFFLKKENPQNYINHISIHRYERAEFFRYAPESPFIKYRVDFSYLDYYPANTDLRIEAKFEKNTKSDTISLVTSTNTIDKYIIVGTANFEFQDIDNILLVLGSINSGSQTLFIPFLDNTSGNTTYGGGRYLDVNYPVGKTILLDFNKAYNPYCAYTEAYTCPLPPKENRLQIAIEAGEKSFPEH